MRINDRVFIGLALVLVASLLTLSGVLMRFDNLYYDLGRYLSFKRAPDNIVIVAIDETSLSALGKWPWSRMLHAELLNTISAEKPLAIGLDVIFSEPETNNPAVDVSLAKAIGSAGNVVLPILLEVPYVGSQIKQSFPITSLSSQAAALGRVHVPLDSDGIARSIFLWEGLSADGLTAVGLPHFSQSVLQVANLLPVDMNVAPPTMQVTKPIALEQGGFVPNRLITYDQRKVNFLGAPGHFQHISYAKVLSGDYPLAFFKDKIVLIGATALDLGDALPTAVSVASQPMSGVEYYANVISAMQDARLVKDAPLWLTSLLCALLALVPLFWLSKLSPLKSLLMIVAYFFAVMLLAASMPHLLHVWVPPAGALGAILLAHPIWSWRKLESAQILLDKELQNLRDELASLGMEQDKVGGDLNEDPLQSRIAKVKLTAQHLRDLHRGRSDTLAFISHDIRAPLGAAMMLLEKFEKNKYSERMSRMLTRAHSMAEGFLQASRAEIANVNKFQELDMVSLTQQAVDDIYEVSMAKQIRLVTLFPEDSLWVRGDFGLLIRAVSNILLNAVSYSPENGVIKVILHQDVMSLTLKIVDQGPGIPPDKINKIFKRFSRGEGEHQAQEGSGLGLYFVKVTVKKHRGVVYAQSEPGHGATFVISLPLERRRNNAPVENDRRQPFPPTFSDTA